MDNSLPAVNVRSQGIRAARNHAQYFLGRLQRGERASSWAANGAGKTTLVKVLMGFAWPLFGARVQVLGKTFGHL